MALRYNIRMKRCFSCKRPVGSGSRPGRSETCESCGSALKACLNCAFYDISMAGACREPSAERVVEKEKANFCDFFFFRESEDGCDGAVAQDKTDPLAALKALFKG